MMVFEFKLDFRCFDVIRPFFYEMDEMEVYLRGHKLILTWKKCMIALSN